MKIRMFNERQDVNNFLDLYENSFGEPMSKNYFSWKYINNPFKADQVPIIVAEENNKIVGARPFQATRIMINREIIHTLQPCDTIVHPKFRREGLFTQMNEFAIKEFQKSSYKILYNFPNKNSFQGYLKQDWQVISKIAWHWKILNPERVLSTVFDNHVLQKAGRLVSLLLRHKSRLSKFPEQNITISFTNDLSDLERIFNEWKSKDKIYTIRDEKYLDWRFRFHPEKEYSFIVSHVRGKPKGYFIFSIEEFMGMKRATISDYLIIDDDPNIFKSLLAYSLNLFKDRNCDVADTWAFMQKWVEEIIEDYGFISSRNIFIRHRFSNKYLMGRPIDKQGFPYNLSLMKWYITPSDADIF